MNQSDVVDVALKNGLDVLLECGNAPAPAPHMALVAIPAH